jgi:hypothetical protein
MAMWTMLGARPVTTLAWESFGEGWVTDAVKQLKLDPTVHARRLRPAARPDQVDWSNDVLFTWNGTTSGVRVPNGDWIPDDREGLSFADATSAVFAYDIPGTRSMSPPSPGRKCLAAKAAHGVLILGPRAVERLESYTPAWPLPKVFRLVSKGQARRRRVQGRDDQHALHAGSRRCDLCARMGEGTWRAGRPDRPLRRERRCARPNRRRSAIGSIISRPIRHPLEDLRLPDRQGADEAFIKSFAGLLEKAKARPSTSPATAMRRRAFASGAARRSTPPTSKRSGRGSIGPTSRPPPLASRPCASRGPVLGSCTRARALSQGTKVRMTQPKVLISDKMDPKAAQIFRERGIHVDEITGKTPDELKAIIGDYDGLAIRSSTKVTKDILEPRRT